MHYSTFLHPRYLPGWRRYVGHSDGEDRVLLRPRMIPGWRRYMGHFDREGRVDSEEIRVTLGREGES